MLKKDSPTPKITPMLRFSPIKNYAIKKSQSKQTVEALVLNRALKLCDYDPGTNWLLMWQ